MPEWSRPQKRRNDIQLETSSYSDVLNVVFPNGFPDTTILLNSWRLVEDVVASLQTYSPRGVYLISVSHCSYGLRGYQLDGCGIQRTMFGLNISRALKIDGYI